MKNRTVSIAFVILVVTAALFLANRQIKGTKNVGADATKELALSQIGIQEQADDSVDQATLLSKNIQEEWLEIDDPTVDGWETEAFTLEAEKQLKYLGRFLASFEGADGDSLKKIATPNFVGTRLLPENLELVINEPGIQVHRTPEGDLEKTAQGPDGLLQAANDLVAVFRGAQDIKIKIKTVSVIPDGDTVMTRHLLELSGQIGESTLEHHATWKARWIRDNEELPQLAALDVVTLEQSKVDAPNGTLLVDCTQSALEHNACYEEQFLHGYEEWLSSMPNTRYFVSLGSPGLAVGDSNDDGMDDLYVCQEQGLPNRLFIQQPDGSLDDRAAAYQVDWIQDARSALFVDFDNDGDQDLAVALLGGVLLASNDGGGKFHAETMVSTSDDLMSLSAADFDNDGDVDIYATAYFPDHFVEHSHAGGLPTGVNNFVYHDSNLGGRNVLLRNDILNNDWSFSDVTDAVGLDENNARFSFIGSWEDYDNDGDQDLYVANDYGRDNLYRNDNGNFVDIAEEAGAEDAASGMSVSWGDYDRDGWMDIYISNMWSSAGKRIGNQPQFKKNAAPEIKQRLQRFARGNTLLRNNQHGHFVDRSNEAGVEMGRWAWGSMFADLNNDGWQDLLIGNGYITADDTTGDL
ncbi:MAG: VCBS repeat-containing protein [Planctomycetota bacterium]|nr:VCBS repeat-containing protein [Planctomycetota bacterium]